MVLRLPVARSGRPLDDGGSRDGHTQDRQAIADFDLIGGQ
jgi:hypothetical protein